MVACIPSHLLALPNRSLRSYATMLRLVQIQPRTARDIAEITGRTLRVATAIMWRMAEYELLHEVEYIRGPAGVGPMVAVYAFGPGKRALLPDNKRPRRASAISRLAEMRAFAHLVHALLIGPTSVRDLMAVSGLQRSCVAPLLRHCREIDFARIGEWERSAGPFVPMWALGSAADAPMPRARAQSELRRRRYEKDVRRQQHQRLIGATTGAVVRSRAPAPEPEYA